ncbi:MAG: hypothetical protein EHM72_16360, partial [Calditrichaeota bacterium]
MKTNHAVLQMALVVSLLLFFHQRLQAYDNNKAHPAINKAIVDYAEYQLKDAFPSSYSIDITVDKNKYTGMAVTNGGYFEYSTSESSVDYRIFEWIEHGGYSADEPELAAAVRHFYDPLSLSQGRKYLTNRGTYWEGVYSNPRIDAIEWALGDTEKGSTNKWSLAQGKEYMVLALLALDEADKKALWGKAFRCLGEVLHNTADMGCPPHTRNDSHAAPLGYGGGWALGSPDPYEEMFDPAFASKFAENAPDPDLKAAFAGATTIRSIHEKLAQFTNTYFFTEQTINGSGRLNYAPINEDGRYPSPLLQSLDYRDEEFIYYYRFPSGRNVKLCKDLGYIRSRTYPYIDKECVESLASELVPNILCAGANVVRLFIPQFQVELNSAVVNGLIRGEVRHSTSTEYPLPLYYSGKMAIMNNQNDEKIGDVDCITGSFEGTLSGLKEGDRIYAVAEFAGIRIRSQAIEVKKVDMDLTQYTKIKILLTADMPYTDGSNYFMFLTVSNYPPYEGVLQPLIWSGSSFSESFDYPTSTSWGSVGRIYGKINGTVDINSLTLTTLEGERIEEETDTDGSTEKRFDKISM